MSTNRASVKATAQNLTWKQELAPACPSCGAPSGQRCPGRRKSHSSRRKKAARMVFAAKSKPRATRRPRPAEFADARLEFETAEERFLRRLQGVGKREEKRR